MTDDCTALIGQILRQRRSRTTPGGVPAEVAAQRLVELPAGCRPQLRAIAERILESFPDADEGDLDLVLSALAQLRDQAAPELIGRALTDRHTMLKEDYVSFLEYLGRGDDAETGLLTVLQDGRTDPDRPDLGVTIRALHAQRATEAVPAVAPYVTHPDRGVRGVATSFLYDLDEDGHISAPVFAERLPDESDPTALETLVDGLVRWDRPPPRPVLDRLAEDPSLPDGVRRSARRAMSHLAGGGSAE